MNCPDIEIVVDTLKNRSGCSLLIGAGCSRSAGIPLASEIVEHIEREFSGKAKWAKAKTYPHMMGALHVGERRDLINRFIGEARMNWAHVAIACLMKHGFVDRILTTNFDPLIVRACALMGVFPAVYDFAASQCFEPGFIEGNAVFHLHGQHSGFILLNTEKEVEKHRESMKAVFADAGRSRTWIVAGYSGDNDPVFEQLSAVERFAYGLYWVGYKDQSPSDNLKQKLLGEEKEAYYLSGGYDADRFFIELAQKLGCFPPQFIASPFEHLLEQLEPLTDFPLKDSEQQEDILKNTRSLIQQAHDELQGQAQSKRKILLEMDTAFAADDFETVCALAEQLNRTEMNQETRETIALAWLGWADHDIELAEENEDRAEELYREAIRKHERSEEYCKSVGGAYSNWGLVLCRIATIGCGDAELLCLEAVEKFKKAVNLDSESFSAFANWGLALHLLAKTKAEDAKEYYEQAVEKYEQAGELRSDNCELFISWGAVLENMAGDGIGDVNELYDAAMEKYEQALALNPDSSTAWYNWGIALNKKGELMPDEIDLHHLACEKFMQALEINPNDYEGLSSWGVALCNLARKKTGDVESEELYEMAHEKFEQALAINPNYHQALHNWGRSLWEMADAGIGDVEEHYLCALKKYEQAAVVSPDTHSALTALGGILLCMANAGYGEANELYALAKEKCTEAEELMPGQGAYNLACVASLTGQHTEARSWLEKARKHGELPNRAHIDGDTDFDAVRDEVWFQSFLDSIDEGLVEEA